MDNFRTSPVLFPVEPEQFLDMIRVIIKEELEKFGLKQLPEKFKVQGMTYKPLYKMDEICEMFDITPPTIYDWIKHGKLKPKKIRSRVFFLWNDVIELLQEKRG
ncbi:MAG TPA: helix-turn-helix domain-containing protein [Puia sp.]|nr:helix-turn-helix domain-containing protein [Puia sp.]